MSRHIDWDDDLVQSYIRVYRIYANSLNDRLGITRVRKVGHAVAVKYGRDNFWKIHDYAKSNETAKEGDSIVPLFA